MSERRIYKNGKVTKIIFTIPVGHLTPEEAQKQLNELIASYKNDDNLLNTHVFFQLAHLNLFYYYRLQNQNVLLFLHL